LYTVRESHKVHAKEKRKKAKMGIRKGEISDIIIMMPFMGKNRREETDIRY